MAEILSAFATTPLPTILTVAGIIFLLLAVTPVTIKGVTMGKPSTKRQALSGLIGFILLSGGVSLYWAASQSMVPTETPFPSNIIGISVTDTPLSISAPITPTRETLTPPSVTEKNIAITEVMSAPCKGARGPSVNEYIEIYNFGGYATDVNGWWIATNNRGDGSSPDKIISWDARNQGIYMGNNVIINSTVIPSSGYAIILSPEYFIGDYGITMPYIFPEGTILLTTENGKYLGNDRTGLLGNTDPLSVIVLYMGTSKFIDEMISTYGSPIFGSSPDSIKDNFDNFPYTVKECFSLVRISASGPDIESNWEKVLNGSPGEGNYEQ